VRGVGPGCSSKWLSVREFEESSKRMRLHSTHPGVTAEEVQARTGFELLVPERVPVTALPTDAELDVLRRRVDPQGLLRR